jgi:large subunit ribosomal protein L25
MQVEIKASKREAQGKGASRRLRRAGRVPGIVYGSDKPPMSIELVHKDLVRELAHEAFHSSILTLDVDGEKEAVLLRDYQMHAFKHIVNHVDFQRVSAKEKIHVKVPLHFINADIAPGVKLSGGIVNHILTELDVSCLPADLPEYIEIDLKDLAVGHTIHVSQLNLGKGVEAVAVHRGEDPAVAAVVGKQLEEPEAAAAPVAQEAAKTESAEK